jgi:hypothetical protein
MSKKTQHLCSGWGVFPGGKKCPGCDDCKGSKIPKTKKEILKHFNKTHSTLTIKKKK